MAKEVVKLFDRVETFFNGADQAANEGLALLDLCIRRAAGKDRDTDALARFVTRASRSGQEAKVKKIIRLAFGDKLIYKADKAHPAGGKFTIGWEGAFNLQGHNAYGMVKKAVAEGKGWNDKAFLKSLNDYLPEVVRTSPEITKARTQAAANRIHASLAKLKADGFPLDEIMAEVQRMLKADGQAKGSGVVVVNHPNAA